MSIVYQYEKAVLGARPRTVGGARAGIYAKRRAGRARESSADGSAARVVRERASPRDGHCFAHSPTFIVMTAT